MTPRNRFHEDPTTHPPELPYVPDEFDSEDVPPKERLGLKIDEDEEGFAEDNGNEPLELDELFK